MLHPAAPGPACQGRPPLMFLGTALIIGGLWWARDVYRRSGHAPRDFRGPLIMVTAGALWLGLFLFGLSSW